MFGLELELLVSILSLLEEGLVGTLGLRGDAEDGVFHDGLALDGVGDELVAEVLFDGARDAVREGGDLGLLLKLGPLRVLRAGGVGAGLFDGDDVAEGDVPRLEHHGLGLRVDGRILDADAVSSSEDLFVC